MTTKIYIEPLGKTKDDVTRPGYRVFSESGDLLVEKSLTPFYDGARALRARGISGRFEMWDRQGVKRLAGDIATCAARYLVETPGQPGFKFMSEETWLKRQSRFKELKAAGGLSG